MPTTMILKPIKNEEITGNESINIKKIKTLMNKLFQSNEYIPFIDILKQLNLTEIEYINAIRSNLKKIKFFEKKFK